MVMGQISDPGLVEVGLSPQWRSFQTIRVVIVRSSNHRLGCIQATVAFKGGQMSDALRGFSCTFSESTAVERLRNTQIRPHIHGQELQVRRAFKSHYHGS